MVNLLVKLTKLTDKTTPLPHIRGAIGAPPPWVLLGTVIVGLYSRTTSVRCTPLPGGGGRYTLERLAGGDRPPPYSPPIGGRGDSPPQDGPPDARGPLEVLVGIVLGELDSSTPEVIGVLLG